MATRQVDSRVRIRPSEMADLDDVLVLYRRVARIPGGLARLEDEISKDYVAGFLAAAHARGLSLVAESEEGQIIGEIHAYTPGLFCFAHVLSDLTIAVDPGVQGSGLGRRLFERFMAMVRDERSDVARVELIARESNARAIRFYETLGFQQEGVFISRIRNLDGSIESDIPMAWVRAPA